MPMPFRLLTSLVFIACLAPLSIRAAERPVVVELFTSQGCSSCPPANAYLNDMVRGRADVLALGFHVTYWDRLGWKDPFSLQAATERQARYGERFGDGSYTPEMVVDGLSGHVGSDRGEVEVAIEQAKRQSRTAATVDITSDGHRLTIDVGSGNGNGRVLLIGFDHGRETAIRRGENGGRTFQESNVVRSIRTIGNWDGAALHVTEPIPEGQDAAVILEASDGRIVGASKPHGARGS
jgi:hypothetical protein